MKLNLGCGDKMRKGWLNVDSRPLPANGHQFLRADIRDLRGMIHAGAVEEIVAWDVLEHMPRADAEAVLRNCLELLKPGGTLEVKMPEIGALLRWSEKQQDLKAVSFRWYGQHDVDPAWMYPQNVHQYCWFVNDFIATATRIGYELVQSPEFCEETNAKYLLRKK